MPFPFDAPAEQQLDALSSGMEALEEFFEQHPNLPWAWSISPMCPAVYFSSTAADALRREFGSEGWTQERCHIWRMVGPVRLEMTMPQPQQKPFVL